jgi:hypothetical protein
MGWKEKEDCPCLPGGQRGNSDHAPEATDVRMRQRPPPRDPRQSRQNRGRTADDVINVLTRRARCRRLAERCGAGKMCIWFGFYVDTAGWGGFNWAACRTTRER